MISTTLFQTIFLYQASHVVFELFINPSFKKKRTLSFFVLMIRWLKIGEDLDLLDSPGVLPSRIADQSGAARLAICNDIGEAAYAVAGIASILVEIVNRIPTAGHHLYLFL